MLNEVRLVLSNELFPVQAFFNAISDDSFLKTLEAFSKGVGASFDDCHCEFPNDLDPDDEPINGIQFALYDQEVVVSSDEFVGYLEKVCDKFLLEYPDKKKDVEDYLMKIKSYFKFEV